MQPRQMPACYNPEEHGPISNPDPAQWKGWDCCQYKDAKSRNNFDLVNVDQVNPERFDYEKNRYQMYAKPEEYDCHANAKQIVNQGKSRHGAPPTTYIPAHTDVRALEQTMYVPIIPSNPGGETEVTFPMTPRTMGQPDVTTACCVPVIPSQPGYKNMTQGILPGPCQRLNEASIGCAPNVIPSAGSPGGRPGQIGPANVQCRGCAPQFTRTPSNVPGGACLGLPDTFPATGGGMGGHHGGMGQQYGGGMGGGHYNGGGGNGGNHNANDYRGQAGGPPSGCNYLNNVAQIPKLQLPHYNGQMGQMGCDESYDGMSNDKMCINSSVVKYQDRAHRSVQRSMEDQASKNMRMKAMYGSYGSYLINNSTLKRYGIKPRQDQLSMQGNGFQWDYPQNPNKNCYVLERNSRC